MKVRARRWALLGAGLTALVLATSCSGGDDKSAPDRTQDGGPDATVTSGEGGDSSVTGSFSSFGIGLSAELSGGPGGAGFGPAGLSAHHTETVVVPATSASVVVTTASRGSILGSEPVPERDRRAVQDAVAGLGVPPAAVTFTNEYGVVNVNVAVAPGAMATLGPQVVDAVERVVGRAEGSGARFLHSDCGAPLAAVRHAAFAGAQADARQLAEAGSLQLGGLLAAVQTVNSGGSDPCDPEARVRLGPGTGLQAFDAPPELRVSLTVSATYAVGGAPAAASTAPPEVSALGRGTATTRADEAYVVVVVADEDESSDPLTKKDRDAVVAAMRDLDIPEDDVDIATQFDYGRVTLVQVELPLADLAKRGKAVVDAVEDVLGSSDTSGVQFWHSQCTALLAKARTAAVEDAKGQAAQLAEAGGVTLGRVQRLSDAGSVGLPGYSCNDDADALLSFDEYGPALEPFDAEPIFTVATRALVGFAIG